MVGGVWVEMWGGMDRNVGGIGQKCGEGWIEMWGGWIEMWGGGIG